MKLSTEKAATD